MSPILARALTIIRRPPPRPEGTERRTVVLTRSEIAACTCPEQCERDHEND
jgi:hypothetical protein